MRDMEVLTLLGCCAVLAVVGDSALAAVPNYTLDIPRESLDAALKTFARQTGLQIARFSDVGSGDLLVGPVSGSLTSAQALKMLLADSELTYRVLSDSTIAIVNQRDAPDANRIGSLPAKAPAENVNTGDRERAGLRGRSRATKAAWELPSGSTQLDEVVVKGIRASLQRSLDIKQESVGVVDAISASDLGNFPDASLGEAMQRIPGVTVTRTMMSGLGSGAEIFAGSPSTVSVRGFGGDFTETLIDGRPQASAAGRAFDFATLGADFAKEVSVYKTPDFAMTSGAVGATVNIKFARPFDHSGLQVRTFASETVTTNDGSFRPGIGALFSDTFFDDTLGILFDGDWSDTHVDSHHLDVVAWNGTHLNSCQMAGGPACVDSSGKVIPYSSLVLGSGAPYFPANAKNSFPSWYVQDYALYNDRTDDRRKDGRAVLQWRPSDTVLVTLDDNYSDDSVSSFRSEYSVWFNGSAIYNVRQDANGTITDFSYGPAPTDLDASIQGSYIKNNTIGINVQWDVSDSLSATLDADQSASHLNPDGAVSNFNVNIGYGPGTTIGGAPPSAGYLALAAAQFPNSRHGGVIIPSDTSNTLPILPTYGPNGQSGNVLGMSPDILGSHVLPIVSQYASDYVNQARIDLHWHGSQADLHGGLQFVEDTRNSHSDNSFTNYAWLLWAGYGPTSANTIGRALPPSLFAHSGYIDTSRFFPGFNNNNQLPPIPLFNPYVVYDYLQRQPANPGTIPGPNPPDCVAGSLGCYSPYTGGPEPVALQPESISFVQEKSYSPFVTWQQKLAVAGLPLIANIGLRYEKSMVTTTAVGRLPAGLTLDPANPNVFAIQYTPLSYLTAHNQYGYFLPCLDLNLLPASNLKVRLDASRTLTRPPLNEITPTVTANAFVGALTATSNNPALLPYVASNFDLGVEWYYGANEYIAVDTFFKHVAQFPEEQTRNVTINNTQDPTTGTTAVWAETQFENAQSADIYGAEIGWQQMLGWGFGYQINGTLVRTNRPYDPYNLGAKFYLPGLANSANFVGFFQSRGFQARLAVNWTGEQLISTVQEQSGGEFGNEPVFTRPFTEVDLSAQYDVTDNLNVFFKALNLSNSEIVEHGRFDNQTLNVQDYGRTFTIGVRARF